MAAIKLHVFRTEMGDDGTGNCDFRGAGEAGAGENDQHRTVIEVDPADDGLIKAVEEYGPAFNSLLGALQKADPGFAGNLASLLGLEGSGQIGLRIGIWDK